VTPYINWGVTSNEIIGAVITEILHDLRVNKFTFTALPEVTISHSDSKEYSLTLSVKEFNYSIVFKIDNPMAEKVAKDFQKEKRTGGEFFKLVQTQLRLLEQSCQSSVAKNFTISLPVFDNCLSGTGICKLTEGSTVNERKALEQFARYFKNEFRFDNIQYEANNHDKNCIGFLFTENAMDIMTDAHTSMPSRSIGGCTFVKNHHGWVLCWAWLHPYFRKKGILSRHWKTFVSEFGDFCIESPVSSSMEAFLKKQSGSHVLTKI
jgi:hypothetical protein